MAAMCDCTPIVAELFRCRRPCLEDRPAKVAGVTDEDRDKMGFVEGAIGINRPVPESALGHGYVLHDQGRRTRDLDEHRR